MIARRRAVTDAERRARLGVRHLLAPGTRADRIEDVTDALVGLHATDPATVYLSAAARLAEPSVAEVERGLYDDLTVTRMLCMRRTMFVVPTPLAPLVHASTARAVAAKERAGSLAFLAQIGWDERRYAAAERAALAALAARGVAGAAELARDVPELSEKVLASPGKSYASWQTAGSRILRVLAAEGRIRRARPRGSWTSSQFRWTTAPEHPADGADPVAAKAALARRYLYAFGPATVDDLKWWTGWTLTDARKALAAVGARDVDLDDGGTGCLAPDDEAPVPAAEPWVALLPGLDPTPMGRRHRDFYLDPAHVPALFDRNGNIGPTVWADGRIVGAWAQRADGEVTYRLLTDVGAEAREAVAVRAGELAAWLGPTRVTPAYRTPLERELAGGKG
ncbi:winged helix DNA-binding domain-containing protein [Streptomyces alboflavus]|uniref:winged helix DNA-binding domain-containing protein n=1 Tax=Streptomyces alboflavus TaxID=67267 RepID=UPI0004C0C0A3|nr:winged helix DNA-binding domain-containing protein [Streptomyces alboflavus]